MFGWSILYDPELITGAKNVFAAPILALLDEFSLSASILACTEAASISSSNVAGPQSQSQLVHSGYEIIGNPIRGKFLILRRYFTVNAINAAAKAT